MVWLVGWFAWAVGGGRWAVLGGDTGIPHLIQTTLFFFCCFFGAVWACSCSFVCLFVGDRVRRGLGEERAWWGEGLVRRGFGEEALGGVCLTRRWWDVLVLLSSELAE